MFATVYGLNVNEVVNTGFVATVALDPSLTPSVCPAHPSVSVAHPAAREPNPVSDFKPIKSIISKMETSDPVTKAVIDNVVGNLPLKKEPIKCDVCNIPLSGQSVYDTHIQGAKHKKKLAQQQQGTTDVSTTPQPNTIQPQAVSQPKEEQASVPSKPIPVFPCNICGITVNSPEQLTFHEAGKQHIKKAAQASSNPGGALANKNSPNKAGLVSDDQLPEGVTKKVEAGATVYTCTLCNKLSNSLDQLNIHMGSRAHKNRTRGVFGTRAAPYDKKKRFAQATHRSFRPGGTLGQESAHLVAYPAYNASVVTPALSQFGFSDQSRPFAKNVPRGGGNPSVQKNYSQMGYNYNSNNNEGPSNQNNGSYAKSRNAYRNDSYNSGTSYDLFSDASTSNYGNKNSYGNASNYDNGSSYGNKNSFGNASNYDNGSSYANKNSFADASASSYGNKNIFGNKNSYANANNYGNGSNYGNPGNYDNGSSYNFASNYGYANSFDNSGSLGNASNYDNNGSYGNNSARGRGGKKLFANKFSGGYNNYDKITPSRAKHYFNAATANQPVYQTQEVPYSNMY